MDKAVPGQMSHLHTDQIQPSGWQCEYWQARVRGVIQEGFLEEVVFKHNMSMIKSQPGKHAVLEVR